MNFLFYDKNVTSKTKGLFEIQSFGQKLKLEVLKKAGKITLKNLFFACIFAWMKRILKMEKRRGRGGNAIFNHVHHWKHSPLWYSCIFSVFRFHPPWYRDDDRHPRDSNNFSLRALLLTLFPSFMGLFSK